MTLIRPRWKCSPTLWVIGWKFPFAVWSFKMPYQIIRQTRYGTDLMDQRNRWELSLNRARNILYSFQIKMLYSVWCTLAMQTNTAWYLNGNSMSLTFLPYSKQLTIVLLYSPWQVSGTVNWSGTNLITFDM